MGDEIDKSESAAWPPAGFLDRDGACVMLGVNKSTLMRWDHEGRVRGGTWASKHGPGRSRIYPALEIERLKSEMRVIHAEIPQGFVDRDEACRMFGVVEGTWVVWERHGQVPRGQWGRAATGQPCRIYAIEELERVMEQMRTQRVLPDRKRRTYHIPAGYIRQRDAARLFGVDYATFHRWEIEGKINCGTIKLGAKVKVYPVEELKRLLAECGKYSPPYPDPEQPGVWRIPLSGHDMHRRDAIIDAEDLPLVQGKRCHWSGGRPDQNGQVVLWDGRDTIRLRQLIKGVSGIQSRVSHRNGDPLDCRRANLFVRTKQEQGRGNRKMKSKNGQPCSSRFKGLCWIKASERWRVGIVVDGKNHYLGHFRDEIAAAEAYDEAARELFGEHARLNFPDGVDAWLAGDEHRRTEAKATAVGPQPQRAQAA